MLKSVLFADATLPPARSSDFQQLRRANIASVAAVSIQTIALLAYATTWMTSAPALEENAPSHFSAPGVAMAAAPRGSDDFVREANKIGDASRDPAEWAFGGYGGVAFTYPTTVTIKNGDTTDMTASGFDWIGRPFKAPVYYGARIQRWNSGRTGGMLDFIHAKAIAEPGSQAQLTGFHSRKPLPSEAPIDDIFSKLEFSHGHNMLTLNGMLRLVPSWFKMRPYLGAGGGVSLPHSEVGFRADNVRTYEYQYAGFVGQGLAGLEIQLGRASLFFEYKFTYAPYNIPLSHEPRGDLLVTDLWRQFQAWRSGEPPPGGRLTTTLMTHHGVAGVLVKNTTPTAIHH